MKAFLRNRIWSFTYMISGGNAALTRGAVVLSIVGAIGPSAVITLVTHAKSSLPITALFISAVIVLVVGITVILLGEKYQKITAPPQFKKEIAEITRVLQENGSLPVRGIPHFSSMRTLTETNVDDAIHESTTLEYTTVNGARLVALKTAPGAALNDTPPPPTRGDYVAGYYQMYNRLKLVRENPDLAAVPLDMLDTLYATEDKRLTQHLAAV
jgi:hypothetical protein